MDIVFATPGEWDQFVQNYDMKNFPSGISSDGIINFIKAAMMAQFDPRDDYSSSKSYFGPKSIDEIKMCPYTSLGSQPREVSIKLIGLIKQPETAIHLLRVHVHIELAVPYDGQESVGQFWDIEVNEVAGDVKSVCPNCGAPYTNQAFCSFCGTELRAMGGISMMVDKLQLY
jgi:hypothetical protein